MIRLTIAALAAAALAVGCGDDEDAGVNASQTTEAAMKDKTAEESMKTEDAAKGGKRFTVKVVSSDFGRVIADKTGEALYLFDKEAARKSECYGECAKAWPPALTSGKPRARTGAKGRLLGTTKRRNGKRQVTYAGHPLYYFKDDTPGNILCQGVDEFGGLWLVVKPGGRPVT